MEGTLTIVTNSNPHGITDNVFRIDQDHFFLEDGNGVGIKLIGPDESITFFPYASVHHSFFAPMESA